jgi:Ca2+-binding EF-hand superfamily protein
MITRVILFLFVNNIIYILYIMSISKAEAICFFNFIERSSKHDNKITREDLEKALWVDTDGDGEPTDIEQTRTIIHPVTKVKTTTTWTEKGMIKQNIDQWIDNANDKWGKDEEITLNEFLEMMGEKLQK